tara:strand:- start:3045 stop:3773 length:729 start_codon:yes stop_codon:yes gene_type:complete
MGTKLKNIITPVLGLSLGRSFILEEEEGTSASIKISELVNTIQDYFKNKGFSQVEIQSHIKILHSDSDKLKIKEKIKNFQISLESKARYPLFNVGIIDLNFILENSNEYHRLLKTLEEPPKNTQLYLIASRRTNIPKTIKSRLVYLKKSNRTIKPEKNLLTESCESILDMSQKIKSLSNEEILTFLNNQLNLENLPQMSYNQISYVQEMLLRTNEYRKMNFKPIEAELHILKKINNTHIKEK